MARSLKKGPYVDPRLLEKFNKMKESGKKVAIKTWARRCTVIPDMVGYTFEVHNGRKHIPVYITESMVGHKLGEFSLTRTFRGHSSKKGK